MKKHVLILLSLSLLPTASFGAIDQRCEALLKTQLTSKVQGTAEYAALNSLAAARRSTVAVKAIVSTQTAIQNGNGIAVQSKVFVGDALDADPAKWSALHFATNATFSRLVAGPRCRLSASVRTQAPSTAVDSRCEAIVKEKVTSFAEGEFKSEGLVVKAVDSNVIASSQAGQRISSKAYVGPAAEEEPRNWSVVQFTVDATFINVVAGPKCATAAVQRALR